MEYNIRSAAPRCCETGKEFLPGDTFYSAIFYDANGITFTRKDYSVSAWKGRPEDAYASWRCEIPPLKEEDHTKPATNEELLEYFDTLRDQPEQADKLFVLTLLLTRRRLFKEDQTIEINPEDDDSALMRVFCPRRNESYSVEIVDIPQERQDEIQEEMERLLYGESE